MATPSPQHLLRQAISAARQGDRSRARMFLAKVTELDPDDPMGWLWRAGLAEEPEQALVWLNRCLDLEPMHPLGRRALPRVRMQAAMAVAWGGDFAMARRLFEQAADADPGNIEPWLHLAGMGRTPEESIACLNEVLRIQPDHAGALSCMEHLEVERRATVGIPTPLSIEQLPPLDDSTAVEQLIPEDFDVPDETDHFLPAEDYDDLAANDPPTPEEFHVPQLKPRFPEHFAPAPNYDEPPPPPSHGSSPRRSTVLIVDDNADVRDFVHRHLESLGLKVIEAEGADTTVAVIREHGVPDLILLDGVMPGIDGFELCNLLRQNADTANTPMVLLARKDGWLPRIRGMMSGFNDTLAKPISPAALRKLVAKYCPLLSEAERGSASWPEIPEEVMQ